jgi:dTDP-4-amino-4,6-dideoxygalactose transaminase
LNQPIWFNRPAVTGREADYMQLAISSGVISGDGAFTKRCHLMLEEITGARKALLTTSCTHALEMAALLLDIRAGDEVVCPAFTFVSSVNAFVLRGARPVFVDVRRDTLNIDERLLEAAITPRTKAIVVVHYAGVACEMDAIGRIAAARGIPIVEDNAHGLFGSYQGRALGSLGAMATLSFHETKNVTCGEGGALIVRDDQARMHAAEILREKGTDRTAFLRGDREKYTWVGAGSSYVLSDLLAAVAVVQFAKLPEITRRKTAQANRLLEALGPYRDVVQLPVVPDGCRPNWHVFPVLVAPAKRAWTIQALRAEGLAAAFHYVPLHSAPYAERAGIGAVDLPVTDRVAASLLRLPISADFSSEECEHVVTGCVKVFEHLAARA